jgi:hypothetical protein
VAEPELARLTTEATRLATDATRARQEADRARRALTGTTEDPSSSQTDDALALSADAQA